MENNEFLLMKMAHFHMHHFLFETRCIITREIEKYAVETLACFVEARYDVMSTLEVSQSLGQ